MASEPSEDEGREARNCVSRRGFRRSGRPPLYSRPPPPSLGLMERAGAEYRCEGAAVEQSAPEVEEVEQPGNALEAGPVSQSHFHMLAIYFSYIKLL